MKTKKLFNLIALFTLAMFLIQASGTVASAQDKEKEKQKKEKKDPAKKRQEILKMRKDALKELYKQYPEAKSQIANAKGYAVFGNLGVNVLLLSTGRGGGIAHDNATGKDTYMKMISAGVGVGIGVKKYYAIFIFTTSDAFNSFLEKGWSAEGQADAAAKSDVQGGAVGAGMSVAPGITLYQLTDKGVAAQATIQGTKYIIDKDLN
jgi:lipid-binding SYLF domain-containing protein